MKKGGEYRAGENFTAWREQMVGLYAEAQSHVARHRMELTVYRQLADHYAEVLHRGVDVYKRESVPAAAKPAAPARTEIAIPTSPVYVPAPPHGVSPFLGALVAPPPAQPALPDAAGDANAAPPPPDAHDGEDGGAAAAPSCAVHGCRRRVIQTCQFEQCGAHCHAMHPSCPEVPPARRGKNAGPGAAHPETGGKTLRKYLTPPDGKPARAGVAEKPHAATAGKRLPAGKAPWAPKAYAPVPAPALVPSDNDSDFYDSDNEL